MTDTNSVLYQIVKDGEMYALDIETQRVFDSSFVEEVMSFGKKERIIGKPFRFDESLKDLQDRGYQRHLRPYELSQILFDALEDQSLLAEVAKDVIDPQKNFDADLEKQWEPYTKFPYAKKYEEKMEKGFKITEITDSTKEQPQELSDRVKEARRVDSLLRTAEWLSVAVQIAKNPTRLIAYLDPKNLIYDSEKEIYTTENGKVECSEIQEFKLGRKQFELDGLIQGFLQEFTGDLEVPYFHWNADFSTLKKRCPELIPFLWSRTKKEIPKDYFQELDLVLSISDGKAIIPLSTGSRISDKVFSIYGGSGSMSYALSRGVREL